MGGLLTGTDAVQFMHAVPGVTPMIETNAFTLIQPVAFET